MLSKEEEDFIEYWSENRLNEQQWQKQLRGGIAPGIFFTLAVIVMLASGWYKRADIIANNAGSILMVSIALIIIVPCFALFHKKQQWDLKEQRYKELCAKKTKQSNQP